MTVRTGLEISPEHGIYGDHREGQPVQGEKDPATGIPVFSLYGADSAPSTGMMADLDVLRRLSRPPPR